YYFYSTTVSIDETDVEDGVVNVEIDMQYSLQDGWLAADLHHHANKNDAFADPEDAIPSMLASGLDVAFLSDHDFTVNNAKGFQMATEAGMAGFLPSEEVSCSWAHFNLIAQDAVSYDYLLDSNSDNHVISAFLPFKKIVSAAQEKGSIITANHPWYDYGLYTALKNEAVPGGYTDAYDTIEINSCCRDSQNIKALNSAMDLWTAYITGKNDAFFGKVEKAHYLVGGSDTHDVLYPNVKNDKGHTSYITYATGKIRTVAEAETVEEDLKATALNYANAVAEGHSYVTLGPVYTLDKTPGETYEAINFFTLNMTIDSLTELKDIVVLSSWGNDTYTYVGTSKDGKAPENYTINDVYEVISVPAGTHTYDAEITIKVPANEKGWVAVMAVDKNFYGMFALTNPYWIEGKAGFPDLDTSKWYAPAISELQMLGILNGDEKGNCNAEANITRAEFATMIYNMEGGANAPTPEGKAKEFSDLKGHWSKAAIDYLSASGVITGYEDGTVRPDAQITRAEMAVLIYRTLGIDEFVPVFDDVPETSWYYNAVMALGTLGIVNGDGNGAFRPNDLSTRAEAAQIISNIIW
ncbi:MAG: S-layer homology domain-containing protein, partial [Clostridia bacterium]